MRLATRILGWAMLIVALALLAVRLAGPVRQANGEANLHVLQAQAFLQGRLDLPRHYHDTSVFEGRYYVPFPAAPAILMLPLVALLGVKATNTVLWSIAVTLLSAWLLWRILRRLGLDATWTAWLLMGFFLGTVYWSCVTMSSGVWFTAHIASVAAFFLATNEALGKKRGLLVGLYLGIAFLSRQLTLALAPFLLALLLLEGPTVGNRLRWRRALGLAAGCAACGALYLAFNWARFGDPLDTGYKYLQLGGFLQARFFDYGLFSTRYVLFNTLYLFVQGFHVNYGGNRSLLVQGMDGFGTSLVAASPFLLAALAARWTKPLLWAAWISVALCLVPQLFYYNNGWWQINGQRFAMDYLPLLMILAGLGVKRVQEKVWKGAIVYAVLLNVLALVVVPWLS
jgi:hypothetical protein